MKTVARLLRYTLRHRARLVFATMLSLAGVAVELARPWPMKVVVDHVLGGRPLPAAASAVARWLPGADTPRGLLAWSLATALALAVGGAAVMMASISVGVAVCQGLVFDLLRDLFGKLQRLSVAYHGRQKVGDLLQRVSGDVLVVFLAVTQVALPALTSSLTIVGMAVIMVRLDAGLALVALAIFPMMAGALVVFAKPLRGSSTRQQACQGALLALVEQSLSAVRMIQGFARESFIQRKVEAGALELAEAGGAAARVAAASGQVIAGASGAVAVAVLGIGATRVIDGRLTIGDLLVFVGYVAALSAPVLALGTSIAYGVAVAARSRRVFEILDCPEEVAERPDAPELGRARGEVVFEAVSFGYDGGAGAPVLRDVSFRAEPGTVTAVVGTTGAGKSSLVGLISRFYDPWRGRVLIDGHDARDVSLRSLRENVALVLQEPFLFPMTVAENIAFGRPGASRAEVIEAARAAYAHDFIERLPQGYDTTLSERGSTLSGGERQRIAIARAVLKDAPILILDEPTSAVDAPTESRIFQAITRLMRDRTTFVISHRLSTIRRADLILALQHGRVVEWGTHESLMEQGSVYADLYRHQHIYAM